MNDKNINPKVTIFVPCFNVENYVNECVDSILAQSYENLEILLIDNNSSDGTYAVLEDYARKDLRIRVLKCETKGLSAVKNMALESSTGDFVFNVDADDIIVKNTIERLVGVALSTDASAVCCAHFLLGEDLKNGTKHVSVKEFDSSNLQDIHEYFLSSGHSITQTWGKLYKREVFEDITFPEGKLYEDIFVFPHIIENMSRCVVIDEALYGYRQRSTSVCASSKLSELMDGVLGRRLNCDFYADKYPGFEPLSYDCLLDFCFWSLGKKYDSNESEETEDLLKLKDIISDASKKAELSSFSYSVAVGLFKVSPKIAGFACRLYSRFKNRV